MIKKKRKKRPFKKNNASISKKSSKKQTETININSLSKLYIPDFCVKTASPWLVSSGFIVCAFSKPNRVSMDVDGPRFADISCPVGVRVRLVLAPELLVAFMLPDPKPDAVPVIA